MGCVVNGPGESKNANIGISLPGTGESHVAPVFEDGEKTVTPKGDNIAGEFHQLVERYIETHYSAQQGVSPFAKRGLFLLTTQKIGVLISH